MSRPRTLSQMPQVIGWICFCRVLTNFCTFFRDATTDHRFAIVSAIFHDESDDTAAKLDDQRNRRLYRKDPVCVTAQLARSVLDSFCQHIHAVSWNTTFSCRTDVSRRIWRHSPPKTLCVHVARIMISARIRFCADDHLCTTVFSQSSHPKARSTLRVETSLAANIFFHDI